MNIERRDLVNAYIQEKGEVQLRELEEIFKDVSSMTLRRDLAYLEKKGEIIRVRGGAKSIAYVSGIKEEHYSRRADANIEAKMKIAQKALKYVESGRSIFLDSGTTIMCLAQILPEEKLSIITSGPNIAIEIIKKQHVSVTLIGGQLSRDTISLSGPHSIDFIRDINIDIAFMATSGFSLESGFTSGNYNECELKKAVIRKARRVILLMDSSKVDRNMPFTFAYLRDIDRLISECPLPEKVIKAALENNVELE